MALPDTERPPDTLLYEIHRIAMHRKNPIRQKYLLSMAHHTVSSSKDHPRLQLVYKPLLCHVHDQRNRLLYSNGSSARHRCGHWFPTLLHFAAF